MGLLDRQDAPGFPCWGPALRERGPGSKALVDGGRDQFILGGPFGQVHDAPDALVVCRASQARVDQVLANGLEGGRAKIAGERTPIEVSERPKRVAEVVGFPGG